MYIRNPETNEWEEVYLPPTGDTLPVGSMTAYGGEKTPTNWLKCDGSQYLKTDYPELYKAIGTTYNLDTDTGELYFRVPDRRERVGVGYSGDGEFSLGNTGGEKEHTLTIAEMPNHNHSGFALYDNGTLTVPQWAFATKGDSATQVDNKTTKAFDMVTTYEGGGKAHNNMPPYIVVNYIIKAKQSVGLVGNISDDINAQGENDVAPTKVIKEYVDKKETYSTAEQVIGTWINNKPLYRKTIYVDSLPNTTTGSYEMGVADIDTFMFDVSHSYWFSDTVSNPFMLAHTSSSFISYSVLLSCDNKTTGKFQIVAGTDRSSYKAYVTILYTKTTD